MGLLNKLFISIFLAFVSLATCAQELRPREFEQRMFDTWTNSMLRQDANGRICALIKVQLPVAGCKFEGNVVDSRFDVSEYWVYMTPGTKRLDIKCPGHPTCSVVFGDISSVVQLGEKSIYSLTFDPRSYAQGEDRVQAESTCYLIMNITPPDAVLFIDNKLQQVREGHAIIRLDKGTHTYRAEAVGYAAKQGSVDLTESQNEVSIALESAMADVRVECSTPRAQIYVNGELKGNSPWSGKLVAGKYLFEARINGFVSGAENVTLSERENRTILITPLESATGAMDINYLPLKSDVWMDGRKMGTSPNVFTGINAGEHIVEIKAEGYQSTKIPVKIEQRKTTELHGELSMSKQSASTLPSTNSSIQTFTVNGVSFNMVRVDGGTFRMGSDDKDAYINEKPVHSVTLSDYYIGETEVTQGLWKAVMGTTLRQQRDKADKDWPIRGEGIDYPMYYINWDDCQEFISRINALTGQTFRMSTEAEWEYAARGGRRSNGYKYSGSDKIKDMAWYEDNSDNQTHPVKTKASNELGLYDMSGNVMEWCSDWCGDYPTLPQTNPIGPSSGSFRVFRGGSWNGHAQNCRVATRINITPGIRCDDLGLRLVLSGYN